MNRSEMSKRAWDAKRERDALFDELNTLLVMFGLPHAVGYGEAKPAYLSNYRYRLYEGERPFAVRYAQNMVALREIVNQIITEKSCGG